MNPYEVLITKTEYDKDDNEQTKILFVPTIIFAYTLENAVKKAVIESGISSDDVNDVDCYVKEFEHSKT